MNKSSCRGLENDLRNSTGSQFAARYSTFARKYCFKDSFAGEISGSSKDFDNNTETSNTSHVGFLSFGSIGNDSLKYDEKSTSEPFFVTIQPSTPSYQSTINNESVSVDLQSVNSYCDYCVKNSEWRQKKNEIHEVISVLSKMDECNSKATEIEHKEIEDIATTSPHSVPDAEEINKRSPDSIYEDDTNEGESQSSGGFFNKAYSYADSILGESENESDGEYSTIRIRGKRNQIFGQGDNASVTGELANRASGKFSSVNGSSNNVASGMFSSVSGGQQNKGSGSASSVLRGKKNDSMGKESSVSGGQTKLASVVLSSVSGGLKNSANFVQLSVPGGMKKQALKKNLVNTGDENIISEENIFSAILESISYTKKKLKSIDKPKGMDVNKLVGELNNIEDLLKSNTIMKLGSEVSFERDPNPKVARSTPLENSQKFLLHTMFNVSQQINELVERFITDNLSKKSSEPKGKDCSGLVATFHQTSVNPNKSSNLVDEKACNKELRDDLFGEGLFEDSFAGIISLASKNVDEKACNKELRDDLFGEGLFEDSFAGIISLASKNVANAESGN